MSGLLADIEAEQGTFELRTHLAVGAGTTVAVLGPNGAGKTTLLRVLAGLVPLRRGTVQLDGVVLDDTDAGIHLPAFERGVGVVFQDHVLFPHLSAVDNVAFGLRARGQTRADARATATSWLERLGLAELSDRRPAQLSGGQAQRVALARALAIEPRLLLLDEPLAALDAANRPATRRELRRHLGEYRGSRVLVTHDPLEALALADELVILEGGRIVQTGTAAEITGRPRTRYVADLVGVNLYEGRAGDGTVVVGATTLAVPDPGRGDVLVVVHPRAVALHQHRPDGSPRNTWEGTVASVDLEGDRARVIVAGPLAIVAEVTTAALQALGVREGSPIWIAVKATEITVFPA